MLQRTVEMFTRILESFLVGLKYPRGHESIHLVAITGLLGILVCDLQMCKPDIAIGTEASAFAQAGLTASKPMAGKPTKASADQKRISMFPFWLAESSRLACRVFAATLPMADLARRACLFVTGH